MDRLVFGTDGWRDIIGERFTTANLGRAAFGYAEHLLAAGARRVVVGHDTRFNGDLFARHAAGVLAAAGLEVLLIDGPVPTPALSFAVVEHDADGGVMLTASHNPPPYSGFKLKGSYGGTATQEIYSDVATRVAAIAEDRVPTPIGALDTIDVRTSYFDALARLIDLDAIADLGGRMVHDAMGGAAAGWLTDFVAHTGVPIEVVPFRADPTPLFYGVNPEPLPQNLAATREALPGWGEVHLVAVTDGDGDRIGAVLPDGSFFNSHQIFAVLLDLLQRRGAEGRVVKTFTVSRVVERLAERRGLAVEETPVGFKYIVDAMLAGGVLIGGEESGGIGVAGHLPERDGIANGLLLLEAVARAGAPLAELFAALEAEAGWRHAYDRLDLHLSGNAFKDAVMASLETPPETVAGLPVVSVERRDGVKLNLGDAAWLLFRPSGTEPVLRIYCEAGEPGEVARILAVAEGYAMAQGVD
jgi:phosphomannomutase